LGEEFIPEINLDINSVQEASWALQNIFPRFKSWVLEQAQHGLAYEVFVGDWQIGEQHLLAATGGQEISIIPLIGGSGRGIISIIGGLALIGLGLATGGAGFLGFSSTSLLLAGGALLLQGIIGSKSPKAEENGQKNSLIFSGQPNVTAVGAAKPLCFGVFLVSGTVVSARIRTFELS
jgi:predicted phage tail protein